MDHLQNFGSSSNSMVVTSPPKKPHFFTFVSPHPHSLNGSLIPKSFMSKYLKGEKCENALLRRGCKKWDVKIEGKRFVKGWEKFEKENGLELGDFIVFRHEGDFVFQVMVFDPSLCEKEFPRYSTTTGEEAKNTATPKPQPKSPKEIPTHIQATSKDVKKDKAMMQPYNANVKFSGNHPSFSATLTQDGINKSRLYVPYEFARLNGLRNRQCEMVIRDERLRPWPVKLRNEIHNKSTRCIIRGGWRKFCIGNGLTQGNEFVLELVESGEKPVMNFHLTSKDAKMDKEVKVHTNAKENPSKHGNRPSFSAALARNVTSKDVKKDKAVKVQTSAKEYSSKHGNRPFFSATFTQSGIDNSILNVPSEFARLSGLRNMQCEMIIRDERLRPWSVRLRTKKRSIGTTQDCIIGRGWLNFCRGNGLKQGDEFLLELVKKGEKPVMNFRLKPKPLKTRARAETTISTPVLGSYPYFIATLNETSIKKSTLYLPNGFAMKNGLSSCEMILRNGNQSSWLVEVRDIGKYVYIGRGWRDFQVANDLKKGDRFKFELVENGKIPIVNFFRMVKLEEKCIRS